MLIKCPECGNLVSDKATVCPNCGVAVSTPSTPDYRPTQKPIDPPTPKFDNRAGGKNNNVIVLIILAIVLATILLGVGGFFVYNNVIKPRQIDEAAPRYYTFAPSVILRSSKSAGADFNKLGSLPYGTELITYNYSYDWSEVKVNPVNEEGKQLKGYIASPFILEKSDFFLLNSIFGDADSKIVIETAKCRRAILNYFKNQGYIGRISHEEANKLGLPTPTLNNQWQVYCLPKGAKTNNVFYKRILRKDSKFTDFAVIIKNINTGERKLLVFYFDDDETPHLRAERPAPKYGNIKNIYLIGGEYLTVDYTDQDFYNNQWY